MSVKEEIEAQRKAEHEAAFSPLTPVQALKVGFAIPERYEWSEIVRRRAFNIAYSTPGKSPMSEDEYNRLLTALSRLHRGYEPDDESAPEWWDTPSGAIADSW